LAVTETDVVVLGHAISHAGISRRTSTGLSSRKPGGRLAISDVVNTAPLSPELQADTALLCGCIAGAAPVERIETWLVQAALPMCE
jgi:hypothetical protein